MEKLKWRVWISDRKQVEYDFRKYIKKGLLRKIRPESRLARSHINKAFHNLDFASFTFLNQQNINKRIADETYFDWVVIISYYAMYHSALAILYELGYKSSSHLATICVLCKKCLGKTLENDDIERISRILGLSEKEINEIGTAKERREKASYSGSISFERYLAEMTLDDARKFVNKAADTLPE